MTANGTAVPLPGLYILDSDGSFIAASAIRSIDEVVDMLDDPEALGASASNADPTASENVSIRVSGFTAAEGIT